MWMRPQRSTRVARGKSNMSSGADWRLAELCEGERNRPGGGWSPWIQSVHPQKCNCEMVGKFSWWAALIRRDVISPIFTWLGRHSENGFFFFFHLIQKVWMWFSKAPANLPAGLPVCLPVPPAATALSPAQLTVSLPDWQADLQEVQWPNATSHWEEMHPGHSVWLCFHGYLFLSCQPSFLQVWEGA